MTHVFAELPRAGLGNMLFVWARAEVFAHINQFPFFTSSWTKMRIGPILRLEKSKRLYWRYFRNIWPIPTWQKWWVLLTYPRVKEPPLAPVSSELNKQKCLYVFSDIPHWRNYFAGIQEHRDYVRSRLWQMLNPAYQMMVESSPIPCIAVHVRRGDFRELQPGEDFARVGLVRTPLSYFRDRINGVRDVHGSQLPVTIFSDGSSEELDELLQMPDVTLSPAKPDIVDLWLLAKSQLLVASAGSSFSYWAAFLLDAPVLLHPDHIQGRIRPLPAENDHFEGGVRGSPQNWPARLIESIKAIKPDK